PSRPPPAPVVGYPAPPARRPALGPRAGPGAAAPPWRLAFVGRAEGRKGFAEALDALARLRAAGRPVELHGVGLDAAEAAMHLAALAPETRAGVVLHGRLDDAAMARVLASAHLVLAPSRYESYGYVYREAGAFARPLVASAEDPSARAYLGETGAGLLAAATEGAAIAEAVARLLDAPALAARLGARGRAHVEGLDPGALARRTLAIYETAVGRGRAVVKDRGA
ncbi:MAG: glycosyltransferase family 4 protein, partial [Paracoccaceae bacterium]